MYAISEWRAPTLTDAAGILFWLAGPATMALIAMRRRALRTPNALTLAGSTVVFCVMAMRNARQIPPFFLCAVPTVAMLVDFPPLHRTQSAPGAGARRRNLLLLMGCAAAAIIAILQAWRSPSPRLRWNPVPSGMIESLSACKGRLYNRYDEGGYLTWFMKDRKIFMDGRQDPFPEELVLEQLRVERTGDYRTLFERYDISCALTPVDSLLGTSLSRDGWTAREAGAGWVVYGRPRT
jgi:hypothetical protein